MSLPTAAILFVAPSLFIACSYAEPVTSHVQACEIVKRAAIDFCLSHTNLTGRYYCEPMPPNPEHYRPGLRYEVNSDELVGSNLIGWFAVRTADGVVLAENVDLAPG